MKVAVQLYAFQKAAIEAGLVPILTRLKAIGYDAVEGFPGHSVNYRADLDRLGMCFAAPHVNPAELNESARLIDYLHAMGCTDVCSSGPIGWSDRSYDNFRATCDLLNAKGRILRDSGIHLHYHNHEFEFLPVRELLALRWLVVEHDPVSPHPLEDLEKSRRYLRQAASI